MNRPILLLILSVLAACKAQRPAQNTSSPSKKQDLHAYLTDTAYSRATVSAYTSFKGTESIPPIDTAYLKSDPAAVLWYVRNAIKLRL